MTVTIWLCTDCQTGNCVVCVDQGPQLDDGTVCECEHDDLTFDREAERLARDERKDG